MLNDKLEELIERYHCLSTVSDQINEAYAILEDTYKNKGKLLVAGNGGSAADAEHIVGELMKKFRIHRPVSEEYRKRLFEVAPDRAEYLSNNLEQSLRAIALVGHEALTTAYINDVDGYGVFAQQLFGYGDEGDAFLAISTSGNSRNIIDAAVTARAMRIKVIGLTGQNGGILKKYADVLIAVPEVETYKVQELHLPVYHCLCQMLEETFFGKEEREKKDF